MPAGFDCADVDEASSMSEAPRSVTVHLAGGLGNQLFQYAFGRRLSLVNNACLYLDASDYRSGATPDYATGLRVCELSSFAVSGSIIVNRAAVTGKNHWMERTWLARKLMKWGRILISFAGRVRPYYLRSEIVEPEENHFCFDPRVYQRRILGAVSVRGFWQTEKYFSDIEGVLRQELVVRHKLSGKNLELAKALENTTSVCVHVRHGDNASPIADLLGVLPREYYSAATRELGRELERPKYYVFSDDIAWAQEVMPGGLPVIYVDHNRGAHSHEDLRLMSMGKHHIIANSTFGWWGAWLGRKKGQIVFAPRRYYQNVDRPNPDLFPPSWRQIQA